MTAGGAVATATDTAPAAALALESVAVGYPGQEVLSGLDLEIPAGGILVVVGTSGCGKSTLLRTLAGLLPVSAGRVLVGGEPVSAPSGDRALVFQEDGLLPWRSVRRNIELPLAVRRVRRSERSSLATDWIGRVGLTGFENHLPRELSGGMRQRVQLARALVARPRVLLMDEPFGALDTQTRTAMQDLLVDVWRRHRTTLVFVTHDVDEALFLGDRVMVLGPRGHGPLTEGRREVLDVPHPRVRGARLTPEVLDARSRVLALLNGESEGLAGVAATPAAGRASSPASPASPVPASAPGKDRA
ncbi:ABC transporter ATP-binding protein [Streptomycetaceae bacterium NBC_01309]